MTEDDELKRINIKDVLIDERFSPPHDQRFTQLYEKYLGSELPVYDCVIPLKYIKPFSLTYYPSDWEPFLPYIQKLKQDIIEGIHPDVWVYQEGQFFVLSDNYPAYYAYLESGKTEIHVHCLGKPVHRALSQIGNSKSTNHSPDINSDTEVKEESHSQSLTVLIGDMEEIMVELFTEVIQDEYKEMCSPTILASQNVSEIMDLANSYAIDLFIISFNNIIFLSGNMPPSDRFDQAFQFITDLKHRFRRPIIVFGPDLKYSDRAKTAGADVYFKKPFAVEDFIKELRRVIDIK